jgi:polysaccharide deacetylase family protein (PEP-CTERM system associated)
MDNNVTNNKNAEYPSTITHAMTIDVEDYYHVSAFGKVISPDQWDQWPSRVVNNTEKLLSLFDRKNIKATFFVLGWVAERHPELIQKIHQQGHEIASHGYSHQLIYKQTPEVFREETAKSKQILEDLIQTPVTGYRAASYSITRQSLWALDILGDLGFTWDSSIFPVHHDRYGIPDSPREPYKIITTNGHSITEFPLTTAKVFGQSVPAAGGGYFRQYPYQLSRWLFDRASLKQTRPQMFYLHPWEIDPEQPKIPDAGWLSNFRHYTNLHRCEARLEQLLDDFNFSSVSNSLSQTTLSTTKELNQLNHGS